MKFDGFHHVGLISKQAEKSLDFYTNGLGGKLVHSFPMASTGKTIYLIDLGNNAVVEIIPRDYEGDETNARWIHIALRTDDAKAAYEEALKAGAVSRSEPKENKLGTMGVITAFVYGPDKEVIEFFQVL